MSAQHSPAPWHINGRPFPQIYGPLGEHIANCHIMTNFYHDNLANARLIAAAPELLHQLVAALYFVEDCEKDQCYKPGVVSARIAQIRDAIAKAKGAE